MSESAPVIELKNVSKVYSTPARRGLEAREVVALDDVSMSVRRGEIFGILGQSGAGKSTLLRCVNRLVQPSQGQVIVDGVDLTSLSERQLREHRSNMGTIFQHFNLLGSRTVADNVAFGLEVAGVAKDEIRARVEELLELVGLADRAKAFPSQLSGGQKQRVGIARALATRPKVLLSDEATSALDPSTTDQILDLIASIRETQGITVLLITHESNVVRRICDSAALMEDGRIVEQGHLLDLVGDSSSQIADQIMPTGHPELTGVDPSRQWIVTFVDSASTSEPVMGLLSRELGVDTSILGGSIERIAGRDIGRLRVTFSKSGGGEADMGVVRDFLARHKVGVSQ